MASLADILKDMFTALSQDHDAHHQTPASSSLYDPTRDWSNPNYPGAAATDLVTHQPIVLHDQRTFHPEDHTEDKVTGLTNQYNPAGSMIHIYPEPNASFDEVQQTLRHEAIHALLGQGAGSPGQKAGLPPHADLIDALRRGGRDVSAGVKTEVPAYAGAYQPDFMPGITPARAAQWNEEMIQRLPPDIGAKLRRLVAAGQAQQPK